MDDSLEFMTMASPDTLLSQASLATARTAGGVPTPPPDGVSKPRAAFVDASAHLGAQSTPYTHAAHVEYADPMQTTFDCGAAPNDYRHLYFPEAGDSSPQYMGTPEETVMSEFFVSPADQPTYTVLESQPVGPIEQADIAGDGHVGSWMETSADLRLTADDAEPDFQKVLNDIRDSAADFERQSTGYSSSTSPSLSTGYVDDDDFERALNSTPDTDADYTPDSDADLALPAPPPKRQYTKRLGRPLTKEERKERKKAQNRAAAIRYRQKKMINASTQEVTLAQLTKRNHALRATIKTTQAEIDIMKRLLNDVRHNMV